MRKIQQQLLFYYANDFSKSFKIYMSDVVRSSMSNYREQDCLVHLYALEGAIHDIEFNCLSEDKKKELKEFSDFLKK